MSVVDIAIIGVALDRDKINSASDFWATLIDPEQAAQEADRRDTGSQNLPLAAVRATLPDHWEAPAAGQDRPGICLFTDREEYTETSISSLAESEPHINWSAEHLQTAPAAPALLRATTCLLDGECVHALVVETVQGQAAAVLITLMNSVDSTRDSVYAVIKGLTTCSGAWTEPAALYRELDMSPDAISYLLVPELADIQSDTASHISGLYQSDSPAYTLPIGTPGVVDAQESQLLPALIQASLALSNKLIPNNPAGISFQYQLSAPLYLAREHRPWFHQQDRTRHAAIHDQRSGLHLVLGEISETSPLARPVELPFDWEAELAVFSSGNRQDMISRLEQFRRQLNALNPGDVASIDIAVALKEELDVDLPYRLAIVFKNPGQLRQLASQALEQLEQDLPPKPNTPVYYGQVDPAQTPKLACIFPGLGFPGLVGRYTDNLFQLSLRIPEIRRTFSLVEQRNSNGDPYPTSHLFFPTDGYDSSQSTILKNRLASPKHSEAENYGIPAKKNLSSFCVALTNWANWMIVQALDIPVAMTFGQSLGELTALCAAGKFDFRELAPMYWTTEVDSSYFTNESALVLVSASLEQIEPLIEDYPTVVIAVHISPSFQLLGGKREEIEESIEKLKQQSFWTQPLPYPAIHTPCFTGLRDSMEPAINAIPVYPSHLDVYSGMTSELYPQDPDTVRTLVLDNADHPVHLWQVTRKMYEDGARVMLQAGGGATMYSHAKTNIGADDLTTLSIDVDYRGPIEQINHMCAALFTAGISPNLDWLYRCRHAEPERWKKLTAQTNLASDSKNFETGHSRKPDQDITGEESSVVVNSRLPFSGKIQRYERDRSLQVEYTLDLANDLHLADHAFITAQEVKPLSECLTVVPMTVSLEIMAQTAAQLVRGYGLVGFRDVSATNWIALRDIDELRLNIKADREPDNSDFDSLQVRVTITTEGRSRPDISGIVVLAKTYYETLSITLPQLENPRLYPLSAEQIYAGRTLFHGPLFQCISGDTWLGDNGVIGELIVNDKQGMFADNPDPVLLSDPLLLDAVGQLIGLWAMERGEYVYPISIGQIEFYAPTPPPGTRVPVSISISNGGLKTLYADIEIQDGSGHLWMRIKQWGDWAFKWPKYCVDYTRRPTQQLLATQLDISMPGRVTACIVENPRSDSSILEMLARTSLSHEEMEHFESLSEYPKRQKQWLIGRATAKDAIRSWLADGEEYLHPATIIIETEDSGRPVVHPVKGCPQPHISISHTDKYTVAIAGDHQIGIDIEAIAQRDQSFIEAVSTPGERQLMERINQDPSQGVTLLWSAKESAGKLAGTGLPNNPRHIELEGLDSDGLLCLHHTPLDVQIRVNSWLSDNHFITIARNADT